ncbi:TPA: O-antigen polymerase, partial [Streptococcus suis]
GIYSIVWCSFIFFSLLILSDTYHFTYYGIMWIFCSSLLLSIGYSIKLKVRKSNTEVDKNNIIMPNISWTLLLIFIILSLIGFVLSAMKYGVSLNVFSDFNSLQNASHTISVQRYSGASARMSILEQILNSFIYVLPLCGGYSLLYADTYKKQLLIALTAVPSVLFMLLTSAKLALVAYMILFFVSYYVSYLYIKKTFIKINFKKVFQALITGFALYQLFYLSFILRVGTNSAITGKIIVTRLGIYAFGHIQAFDVWIPKYLSSNAVYGLGGNTFLAFSSLLGFMDKIQGVYEFISESPTNVFTQFRALITDFGLLFGLFIILLLGVLLNYLNENLIISTSRAFVFQQVLYISILFYLFYFIVSPWTYLTFILAFVIFYFYLIVAFHIRFKIRFH